MAPATHPDLGHLLAVFAHPDDEAYLAGALMAVAADAGRRVVCVTATRGELGFPADDPRSPAERKAVREAELAACLTVLGVEDHRWLDYPDGGCVHVPDHEPAGRLAALIDEVRPDTVLTFGPDGQTFHDDHISVSRWTTYACRRAAHPTRLLYAAMTPEWTAAFGEVIDLDQVMMVPGAVPPTIPVEQLELRFLPEGTLLERKIDALACQASQIGPLIEQVGRAEFARLTRDELYRAPTAEDWPEPPPG
jgi:LmbE family N-acetylglucosaminyl deacetylase